MTLSYSIVATGELRVDRRDYFVTTIRVGDTDIESLVDHLPGVQRGDVTSHGVVKITLEQLEAPEEEESYW